MRIWALKTKMKGRGLSNLARDTRAGVGIGLALVGKKILAEFKKQVMATPKHGRLYRLKNGVHIASAGFETPANRSGHYRDAIGAVVNSLTLTIGNHAEYANYLEHGTGRHDKKNKVVGRGEAGKTLNRLMKKEGHTATGMQPRQGIFNAIEKTSETQVIRILEKSIRLQIK